MRWLPKLHPAGARGATDGVGAPDEAERAVTVPGSLGCLVDNLAAIAVAQGGAPPRTVAADEPAEPRP